MTTPPPDPAALAKQRFFLLQALRFGGALMAAFGVVILTGKLHGRNGSAVPELAGYALLVVGAVDALFLPVWLARLWKRQDG